MAHQLSNGLAAFASALSLFAVAACTRSATDKQPPPRESPDQESQQIERLIADYQSWPRLNKTPVRMADVVALLCRQPGSEYSAKNPHQEKYLTAFATPEAAKVLRGDKPYQFPAGTVIVKQKLAKKDSTHPEMLTVMVKGEKGSRPEFGDWKFFTAKGDGRIDRERRDSECMACHKQAGANDYVFATYLSF